MTRIILKTSAMAAILALTACATASGPTTDHDFVSDKTAHDVMKEGGTYEYPKPTEPVYANSSADLAKKYVGRHVDELPEATSSHKAVQNGNEVVCKVVKRTHSRLRAKKVCATKKEWDQHKADAVQSVRNKQVTRRAGD